MKALCINVQPIKKKYSKFEGAIEYPKIGQIYEILFHTVYTSKNKELKAVKLREIRNRKVKIQGRELHFPITWFITDDNPAFEKIALYYQKFH